MATPHFSISYGSLPHAAGIGIIVPKKAIKSSVERHRLKRRVRDIVRESLRGTELRNTLIISARAGAAGLSYDEIKNELSRAFRDILLGNESPS